MKKTLLAALAIAGFAVATSAQAQTNIGSGSALLYFNKIADKPDSGTVNLSNSLVVNLGDLSSNFSSFNLSLNTALEAAYGSGWATDDTIKWAVFGGFNSAAPTPYSYGFMYSRPQSSLLDLVSVYNLSNKTDAFYAEANAPIYTTGSIASSLGVNHTTVVIENGTLSSEGAVSNGAGPYAMDLNGFDAFNGTLATFRYQTNSQNIYFNGLMNAQGDFGDQPAIQTGTISLGSDGTLSVNSVPEPSTYALIGFGALLLIVAYRRANA
ncbi:MAG: PEP-CTERM sorting domain-containing protein [Proteobacteria bacterium]|nr:PEP-CTERM sorting domain-containing protein [Pseudomonadota bacterium]